MAPYTPPSLPLALFSKGKIPSKQKRKVSQSMAAVCDAPVFYCVKILLITINYQRCALTTISRVCMQDAESFAADFASAFSKLLELGVPFDTATQVIAQLIPRR
jgi:hypothetical protein